MKLRQGLRLREICGEKIAVAEGLDVEFNKMLHFNESAAYLWEQFYGKEFEVSDLASTLVDRYGIDLEVAVNDAGNLVESWREAGVIADCSESKEEDASDTDASLAGRSTERTEGTKEGFLSRIFGKRKS